MITDVHFKVILPAKSKIRPHTVPLSDAHNYNEVLNEYHRAKKLVKNNHITIYITEIDKNGLYLPERKSSLKEIKQLLQNKVIKKY